MESSSKSCWDGCGDPFFLIALSDQFSRTRKRTKISLSFSNCWAHSVLQGSILLILHNHLVANLTLNKSFGGIIMKTHVGINVTDLNK